MQAQPDRSQREAVRSLERRVVRWTFYGAPLVFVLVWLVAAGAGKALLFLQPTDFSVERLTESRLGWIAACCVVAAGVVWAATFRLSARLSDRAVTTFVVVLTIVIILLAAAALQHQRSSQFFREIVKVRAPQLTFPRNIVFMQQRLPALRREVPRAERLTVGLVGSSQVNLGVDELVLSEEIGDAVVQKLCLPGMVPFQYMALSQDLADIRFDVVVCWLSEFDFYREREIPTTRIRWCMTPDVVEDLSTVVGLKQRWANRGAFADLWTASRNPIWRQKDLIRTLIFRTWWRFDEDIHDFDSDEQKVGARLADREQGVTNARSNIQHTVLVDANFDAFELFSRRLVTAGTRLVVVEGESHPETMAVYPFEFREETRRRLTDLSTEIGFDLVFSSERVQFNDDDWKDAVHLNEQGRIRFTNWLGAYLRHSLLNSKTADNLTDAP